MPIFSRKILRQALGLDHIGDTLVSTTTGSCGAAASMYLIDSAQANLAFSGESLHERAHLRVNGMDLRVASFNTGSGAYVTLQQGGTIIASGAEYERHLLMSAVDKDRALNVAIGRVKIRREVTLQSTRDLKFYDIDTAGTPDRLVKVLDAYYFGDAANSLSRSQTRFDWWKVTTTGSGTRELRVQPSLDGTAQIVLDAVLQASLGALDTATVNLPDDKWILYGAEVDCWTRLIRGRPGQDVKEYMAARKEAARRFTRLSASYAPQIDEKLEFDTPI